MEVHFRPKSDYMHQASFEQLHALSKHWMSEVQFFKDELTFLQKLIDKYFMWLMKDENINNLQALSNKLIEVIRKQKSIEEEITKHIRHLENLIESPFSHDEQVFRDEHSQLEDEMQMLFKSFREIKKEVFAITEHVIEEEKVKHLISEK